MERCCFTNAFMGLMAGSKATGSFPSARDPGFVRRSQAFLLEQIRMQQPQLILTLGIHVPKVLAPLAPELMPLWNRRTTFRSLDNQSTALVSSVHFPGVNQSETVATLMRPCQRLQKRSQKASAFKQGMNGSRA
jgi:uracil-DNA glycosylase